MTHVSGQKLKSGVSNAATRQDISLWLRTPLRWSFLLSRCVPELGGQRLLRCEVLQVDFRRFDGRVPEPRLQGVDRAVTILQEVYGVPVAQVVEGKGSELDSILLRPDRNLLDRIAEIPREGRLRVGLSLAVPEQPLAAQAGRQAGEESVTLERAPVLQAAWIKFATAGAVPLSSFCSDFTSVYSTSIAGSSSSAGSSTRPSMLFK